MARVRGEKTNNKVKGGKKMRIAKDKKNPVQEIASSHDARTSVVEGLKKEANELKKEADGMVGSFKATRDEVGVQLRQDLARDRAKMRAEVRTMLSGFQSSRKKMGTQLRKELAHGHDARASEVEGLKKEADGIVGSFKASQDELGAQLRHDLAHDKAKMGTDVRAMSSGFQSSHKKMSSALKKGLAQGAAARKSETHVMLNGSRKGTQLRKANTTVKAKSKAVKANGKNGKKAAPVKDEPYDMETRLLAAIRKQPGGVTMTEVSKSLDIATIVFRHVSRRLLDEGKIRMEHNIYFPAS